MTEQALLQKVANLVTEQLEDIVQDIDINGFYPEMFMRELGKIGGYQSVGTLEEGGNDLGLATQIEVIREVGKVCGATAFSVWCQSACGWYLHCSPNNEVRARYLLDVLRGNVLAGTGMSNTMKHLSGIEDNFLCAQKVEGGYRINGVLPWVSNLGENHIWANTARLPDGGYVMFITGGGRDGVMLNPCPEFCALEGTRTFALRFENAFVPHADVLAQPEQFFDYIQSIKSGFILLQIGMGAGIIDGCLKEIEQANIGNGEINLYLDTQIDYLKSRFDTILNKTLSLAQLAWENKVSILTTLQTRLSAAQLCLDAAQSAALHMGAKGYLRRSPVQRRVREAMFVAIVTPSIKHLRKEISELEFIGEFSI